MNYQACKYFILDKLERELPSQLTYHGLHHTLDVLAISKELCYLEEVPPHSTMLLKTAALFHDSGFTISNRSHEELGCEIARKNLPRYGFSQNEIEIICGMIMATKVPQQPRTYLESIICDADLDYLGREDFYDIGATLYEELRSYKILETEEAWNRLQVKFLENHQFWTSTNRKRRTGKKRHYLHELRHIVSNYEKK